MLNGKKVLIIITGGIAAYKSLELVRKLKDKGVEVIPVMTKAAENFVTPMSVSALSQEKVFNQLFDLTDEAEMGQIVKKTAVKATMDFQNDDLAVL